MKKLSKKIEKNFSEKVREVVRGIPRGMVMTYAEVARKAGNAKAVRVVGSVMARNFDSTVPCHRVVRSDGSLGNYNRGGMEAKRKLLQKEGVKV